MQPVHINGTTRVLGEEQGFTPLPILDMQANCKVNGVTPVMVTAWMPSPEELKALNNGRPVFLQIQGRNHPPVAVWVEP